MKGKNMFFKNIKRELVLVKAFQKLFLDEKGGLKDEAKVVIAFFRDEAGGRGELGNANGVPYFYDNENRFDVNAGAFLLGKRRMFDLVIKYLALDEREVFTLLSVGKRKAEDLEDEINV